MLKAGDSVWVMQAGARRPGHVVRVKRGGTNCEVSYMSSSGKIVMADRKAADLEKRK